MTVRELIFFRSLLMRSADATYEPDLFALLSNLYHDIKSFDKISDYLLIFDLSEKSEERRDALKKEPVDNDKIRSLNAKCLDLCETCT